MIHDSWLFQLIQLNARWKRKIINEKLLKFLALSYFYPFQKALVFSYFLFALALNRATSTFSKICPLYLRTKVYRGWVHFHLCVNYHFKNVVIKYINAQYISEMSLGHPPFISLHLPPSLCPSLFRVWDEQSVIVERPQHTARNINTHFSCSCQNKGPYEKRNRDSLFCRIRLPV